MKKLFILLLILIFNFQIVQAVTYSSRPAAPYTEDAARKIANIANKVSMPIYNENQNNSKYFSSMIQYFNQLFKLSGYDFQKTMNNYIHDTNKNYSLMSQKFKDGKTIHIATCYITLQQLYTKAQEPILKQYFCQEVVNYFNRELKNNTSYYKITMSHDYDDEDGEFSYWQDRELPPDDNACWFPVGINKNALKTYEMYDYKIVSQRKLSQQTNPWKIRKIQRVQMSGRPVIEKDLINAEEAQSDYEQLRMALKDKDYEYGHLSNEQERRLQELVYEYGEDLFDDNFMSLLNLYRDRQAQNIISRGVEYQTYSKNYIDSDSNTQNKKQDIISILIAIPIIVFKLINGH